MVSFFGLKIGGDKKKKPETTTESKPQWKRIDQNLLGEGQYFGQNLDQRKDNGSIRSVPRPGTSHSVRRGKSPYDLQTHNLAASSMFDLSQVPHQRENSLSSLKPHKSAANLRTNFGNASSTSLAAPPALGTRPGTPSRPGTSHSQRSKTWVSPLDVHFARSTPVPPAPRSPLGQFELQVNVGGDDLSLLGEKPEKVAQAITNQVNGGSKPATTPPSAAPINGIDTRSPPGVYPSPPHSVNGVDRNLSGARTREPPNGVNGPAGLPSPPMSQTRGSEDGSPWEGKPVIQNVAAKRDTLHINGPKRQSLSMKIEELEKTLMEEQQNSHKPQNNSTRSPTQANFRGRNPNEQRPQQVDRMPQPPFANNGPRPQSPGGMRGPMNGQRPQSPMGRGPPRPHSPAGMRGPRHQSPMSRGPMPRPQSPAGMRGPRHQSPMGRVPRPESPAGGRRPFDGPRPESPMGGRRPFDGPRPQSPMGRGPPRPRSPAGVRGPMPSSPRGFGPRSDSKPDARPDPRPPVQRPESPVDRRPMNRPQQPRSDTAPELPVDRRPMDGVHKQNPLNRGPPLNRPPRPAPEEYGVSIARTERPHGPPAAAAGVHSGGIAPNRPHRPNVDDAFSFPFQQKPQQQQPPVSPPQLIPSLQQQESRKAACEDPTVFTRPRPPPLVNLGNSGPPTPSLGDWPLPSPSATQTPRSARAPPPAPLNLNHTAEAYTSEIPAGPWTPPLPLRMNSQSGGERPSTATGGGGTIGMARGLSIRDNGDAAQGPGRRPDFGLKSPTGIADRFGTSFI